MFYSIMPTSPWQVPPVQHASYSISVGESQRHAPGFSKETVLVVQAEDTIRLADHKVSLGIDQAALRQKIH